MAIPMFILAGNLLSTSSSARRIVDFAKTFAGHLPGGLPIAAIFASIIFAAVSGSSPATVAAIGSLMFGAITAAGYPKTYAVWYNYCLWKFRYINSTKYCYDYLWSNSKN